MVFLGYRLHTQESPGDFALPRLPAICIRSHFHTNPLIPYVAVFAPVPFCRPIPFSPSPLSWFDRTSPIFDSSAIEAFFRSRLL